MELLKSTGIVIALDTSDIDLIRKVVETASPIKGITGFKIGLEAAISQGLKTIVKIIKRISDKPVIYDHQKAMNDVPHIGRGFAKVLREAGVDAAIGFPHAGPRTMATWVEALRGEGVIPIIGGEMTHEGYLRSERGYISDDTPERIYTEALELGVEHFVLPGNKVDKALRYAEIIARRVKDPVFLLPGARMYIDWDRISSEMIPIYRNVHLIVGRTILRRDLSVDMLETIVRRLKGHGDE